MNWVECCYLPSFTGKNGFFPPPSLFIVEKNNTFHIRFTFYKCRHPSSSLIIWYHILSLITVSKGRWKLLSRYSTWQLPQACICLGRAGGKQSCTCIHIYVNVLTSCCHLSHPNLWGKFCPWPSCASSCSWSQTILPSRHPTQTCLAFTALWCWMFQDP